VVGIENNGGRNFEDLAGMQWNSYSPLNAPSRFLHTQFPSLRVSTAAK
jgi:hypothetical protein